MPTVTDTKLTESARKEQALAFVQKAVWKKIRVRATGKDPTTGQARVFASVFTDGCPPNIAREVLQILAASSPVTDPTLDNEVLPGTFYHRAAFLDKQPKATGTNAWCIFRELSTVRSSETNVVDDGCGSRTSYRLVFDAVEVEPYDGIEHAGQQGFQVKIAGINRDPETLLVSYYVSTTERKTQYVGEAAGAAVTGVKTGEDAYGYDFEARWQGLRGNPAAPTDDSGDGVTVWDPAVRALGELLTVDWSRNLEDCTLDATGRRVVSKPAVTAEVSNVKTLFDERTSTRVSAAAAQLGDAPEPSGGVVTSHQSGLRKDGKYDTEKLLTAEKTVVAAEASESETLTERETVVTDRSVTATSAVASAAGGVIVNVRKSRTPGDRLNVVVGTKTEKPLVQARVSRERTVFGVTETIDDANQSSPPLTVTPGAGVSGGESFSRTPGGQYSGSTRKRTETAYPAARTSSRRTLFSRQSTTVNKSSSEEPPEASAGGGTGRGVGVSVTEGGRRDIEITDDVEVFVGGATYQEIETLFERIVRYTDANSQASRPPASYAGGVIQSTGSATQPLGSRNISVETKTEKPVEDASVSASGDLFHTESQVSSKSVADPGAGIQGNTEPGVLKSRVRQRTPGDKIDVVDSLRTFLAVADATVSKTGSIRELRESHGSVNQAAVPAVAVGYQGPGLPIVSLDYRKTAAGQFDVGLDTRTPTAFSYWVVRIEIPNSGGLYQTIVHITNATEANIRSLVETYAPGCLYVPGYRLNDFGLYDGDLQFVPIIAHTTTGWFYEYEGYVTDMSIQGTEGGVQYVLHKTMYVYHKRDFGISSGWNEYLSVGGTPPQAGSSFSPSDGDRYSYVKVSNIWVSQTPVELSETPVEITAEA